MVLTRIVGIAGVLALLAGCGGTTGSAVGDGPGDATGVTDGASSSGVDDDGFARGGAFEEDYDQLGGAAVLDNRVIYFGFDDADVDAGSLEVLEAHGAYLAENAGISVRLEGHADERGSREYNIGLGERRAHAVRQILLLQGVTGMQISTVSYGEERPAALGSDEETWSLNRRVELIYAD